MNELLSPFGGTAVLCGLLFLAFLTVLWAILPFAVFGLKHRLDLVRWEQQQTNRWLKHLAEIEEAKRNEPETIR